MYEQNTYTFPDDRREEVDVKAELNVDDTALLKYNINCSGIPVGSETYLLNGLVNPIFNPALMIGMLAVPRSLRGSFK